MRISAGIALALATLVLPASASAADTFVDDDRPDDTGNCLAPATACKTIGGGIAKATSAATVHVAPGTYTEHVSLGSSKSLVASGAASQTVIDPSTAGTGVTVPGGDAAGTIQGFTIHSVNAPSVLLEAGATVRGNVFDDPDVGSFVQDVRITDTSGTPSVTVTGNTFIDPSPTDSQIGLLSQAAGSPRISNNTFTDFRSAIEVRHPGSGTPGTPVVSSNVIEGTHAVGMTGVPWSMIVDDMTATITDNVIRDPDPATDQETGIFIFGFVSTDTGATLRRNRILGHSLALDISDTDAPVSLDGDVIANNFEGMRASDTDLDGDTEITATNITEVGNAGGLILQDNHLTLDSSILLNQIGSTGGGTETCTISFSRGPAIGPDPNGCDNFQTILDPQFDGGGFHLESGSPVIDQGNPAAASGTDIDGDARALDGNADCGVRRDIGADEFRPAPPGATAIATGPGNGSAIGDPTPTFTFSAGGPPCTSFQCRVDGGAFAACGSPRTLARLPDGGHTFRVRARDLAGQVGPAASRSFTVDTTAPDSAITDGPKRKVKTKKRKAKASFEFSSDDPDAELECSLDGGAFEPCSSPVTEKVKKGAHSFEVRGTDRLGNVEPEPATHNWKVKRRKRR